VKRKLTDMSLQDLKKRATILFQLFVRLDESDKEGRCKCVTCGTEGKYTEMHAGHFEAKGSGNSTRFIRDNCHVQCNKCNTFMHGNLIQYTFWMLEKYGEERVNEIRQLKHQTLKIPKEEFIEMVQRYNADIKEIRWRKGI